ncbi:MAG: O-antigen ligase family protein [Calditrichaeota bacterium]|nr:O-antigen ligase family protein [Calditrichota bacterium]MCB9366548.1 O-antigen ligase family protein [Calditrichota bacterium]MCB9391194.1 O-antigen ligase family protein [Calditrichota bacterium]
MLVGLAAGLIIILLLAIGMFWGRALIIAAALLAGLIGLAVFRYPVIGTALIGFTQLSNIAEFVPGSTSALFGAMLLIVVARKLFSHDTRITYTSFYLAIIAFAVWFQASALWSDSLLFYDWKLMYRVLLAIAVLHELVASEEDLLGFMIGAAAGMIFTAVSAVKTAYEFYVSGVADQVASAVTNIESSRFYGHWMDPNIMSITLVFFLGAVIALWRSQLPFRIRGFMMLAAVGSIVAIMISLSRGGLIGAAIVVVLMLGIERRRWQLLLVFGTFIALLVLVAPFDLFGRVAALVTGDASTSERSNLILSGIKLFQESPIWGLGMGVYDHRVTYILPQLQYGVFAHNTFIDVAVNGGLIGLVLFFLCWWLVMRKLSWRDWNVDRRDTLQLLNAGFRASLVSAAFCLNTLSGTSFVPFWTLFTLIAMLGLLRQRRDGELVTTSGQVAGRI